MTLDEAIELLKEILHDEESQWDTDAEIAFKLGIDALGTIRAERKASGNPKWLQLPS